MTTLLGVRETFNHYVAGLTGSSILMAFIGMAYSNTPAWHATSMIIGHIGALILLLDTTKTGLRAEGAKYVAHGALPGIVAPIIVDRMALLMA